MALTSFKVADFEEAVFVSVAPKTFRNDDGNDEQREDRETGHLLWMVNIGVFDEKRGRIVQESFDVTIVGTADGKSGLETLRRGTQVRLENLRARMWSMDSGSGMSFTADKIVPLTAAPAPKAS